MTNTEFMGDFEKMTLSELDTYYNLCVKMLEDEARQMRMNGGYGMSRTYKAIFDRFNALKDEIRKRLVGE